MNFLTQEERKIINIITSDLDDDLVQALNMIIMRTFYLGKNDALKESIQLIYEEINKNP